jgi:L-threonylcarbamoyladenylate synthase
LETAVLKVDASNPDMGPIRRAAAVIRAGGLVAFPTETVYGLGANALDAAAVARIFEAKGRPATNPVIVHVSDASEVRNVASNWPETASKLAGRFWPGPLTLVVPKADAIPPIVTAGGTTVAVRCPNHPVARALIREAGVPVAAPSANRSTELSPTRAEHVLKGLNGRIDLLLDGGPCSGGIESTVVDVTGDVPRVLRPGLITVPMLEEVVGSVEVGAKGDGVSRSPGQMARHYSPRTPVIAVTGGYEANGALEQFETLLKDGNRVGMLVFGRWVGGRYRRMFLDEYRDLQGRWVRKVMPVEPEEYAAKLYDVLHELDLEGWHLILVELPPDTPEWAAVRDRLTRAASK